MTANRDNKYMDYYMKGGVDVESGNRKQLGGLFDFDRNSSE